MEPQVSRHRKWDYSSQLSYGEMRHALAKGYAVAGSDMGHTGGDLQFAAEHPAKMEDWAYRAVHVMSESAKPVLRGSEHLSGTSWARYIYRSR